MLALYLFAAKVAAVNIPPGILDSIPPYSGEDGDGVIHQPSDEYKQQVSNVAFVLLTCLISLSSLLLLILLAYYVIKRRIRLSEDELMREEENQAYLELNSEEQELYFQSKEYLQDNPSVNGELTLSQNLLIQEKGVRAWEFVKDPMLTNNDLLILNKYELNFFKNFECSSQTNLPIPNKNDVYYFESKIYSLPNADNTKISIGLGCKPYPWFRLPGRHVQSVSYDSDGYRRFNQPFKFPFDNPFPKIVQGDVIGIGLRTRSGTIFFTRNGKKISESKIGGHIKNFKIPNGGQIFPIIGANNLCSVHVNLGQMGFVFIEGNVKKWGFAPLEGTGPAPPIYNKFNTDILLERSEIDDDNNDLTDRENDFPPDFWDIHGNGENNDGDDDDLRRNKEFDHDKFSYNAYSEVNSNDERITLNSLVAPVRPPSYEGEDELEDVPEGFPEDFPEEFPMESTEQQEDDANANDDASEPEVGSSSNDGPSPEPGFPEGASSSGNNDQDE
ncbi:protein Ear1p [[Candida] railenensis]|uniref:Protein Ear1p n=1 Tax=[Candida] railenensis TaxID=45579 RepID=A0A9P0QUE1_9ASCO|nr:protein Ear1p [[Candida] railenensis]